MIIRELLIALIERQSARRNQHFRCVFVDDEHIQVHISVCLSIENGELFQESYHNSLDTDDCCDNNICVIIRSLFTY